MIFNSLAILQGKKDAGLGNSMRLDNASFHENTSSYHSLNSWVNYSQFRTTPFFTNHIIENLFPIYVIQNGDSAARSTDVFWKWNKYLNIS